MTQKELNVNRAEMTSLKLELESMISGRNHERSQSGDIPALEERQIDVNGKAADSVPREDVVNESPVTQSGPISSTTDMSKETMSSSGTLTNVYTESNGEDGYKSMLTSDELSSHETRRDSVDEKHETVSPVCHIVILYLHSFFTVAWILRAYLVADDVTSIFGEIYAAYMATSW